MKYFDRIFLSRHFGHLESNFDKKKTHFEKNAEVTKSYRELLEKCKILRQQLRWGGGACIFTRVTAYNFANQKTIFKKVALLM